VAPCDWIDLPGTVFRSSVSLGRGLLVGLACLALTACGGGGGGGGGTPNQPPTASFTATPTIGQVPLSVVFNAAASSDPDGNIASYSWNFGDNTAGSGVAPSHTFTTVGTFTVTLTVTDNLGAAASTTRTVTTTSGTPPTTVTVSGRITFERVPFSTTLGRGLNYPATFEAPAREVEVDLVQSSNQAILATTSTDANGNYSFNAPPNSSVIVRAKALTRHTGTATRPASWDLRVRNNTNGNALYVLDSSVFNTGSTNQTRNLTAATGWGGGFAGVYTGTRAAAPFAVLDTLYEAAQFVITQGDSSMQLVGDRALSAYWSEQNVPSEGDVTAGQIGTTAYYPRGIAGIAPGIYVLGAASNDTDEFDAHVVAHEFLHYLEDVISRTDTVGGPHSLDEWLDMRVAFSEGYGNAFSAMVLNDPVYRDSFGTAQSSDFHFSVESRTTRSPGWYSETSAQRILWDLFDSVNDGADAVSIGYGPMHQVFTSTLRDEVPLTSLFSFITALKQIPGVPAALVDQLVEAERVAGTSLGIVSTTMDAYATTETNSGVSLSSADLVLPIYTPVTLNGSAVRVCTSSQIDTRDGVVDGTYNKLGNRRFLRFNVPSARTIRITSTCDSRTDVTCAGDPVPDPDFVLTRAFDVTFAESSLPGREELVFDATAGDYVLEVYEWSHVDFDESRPRRGRTCMTVNITG
jgi:PKD repeat protein